MVTNHWLKKFKETKRDLGYCRASLCDSKGDYFGPHKMLNLEVPWTFEEVSRHIGGDVPCIYGVSISLKALKNVIWTQDYSPYPFQLLKGDTFTVNFRDLMVGQDGRLKWKLDRFFTYDS